MERWRNGTDAPGRLRSRPCRSPNPSSASPPTTRARGGGCATRLGIAIGLLIFVTVIAYLGRDGYRDLNGTPVGFLDALYYSTVSITTTGYGDITPVTDEARLVTTVLITPARILFLIILIGTTIEVLAERTRTAFRERIWRSGLNDHTIVIGFGTKGRAAVETLLARGVDARQDRRDRLRRRRDRGGHPRRASPPSTGPPSRTSVLEAAGVRDAASVIVATDRDDAAVLVTLTARELDPDATIVAAAREAENVHLLKQSGADSVILSSAAAGRLLGQAVHSPQTVEVLEDLLSVGSRDRPRGARDRRGGGRDGARRGWRAPSRSSPSCAAST